MRPRTFWLTSPAAAIALSALVALLLPYGMIGAETTTERQHAWLLTTFTMGVMAVCFGAASLLAGAYSPVTVRDVDEAGDVLAALAARRESRERLRSTSMFYNFAGWTIVTGGFLLLVYFAGWLILGR